MSLQLIFVVSSELHGNVIKFESCCLDFLQSASIITLLASLAPLRDDTHRH